MILMLFVFDFCLFHDVNSWLQVSELAVSYHQQRVELGLSVPITKEQQIDVARQCFAAFLLCVAKLSSAGMTSASLSASSTDR